MSLIRIPDFDRGFSFILDDHILSIKVCDAPCKRVGNVIFGKNPIETARSKYSAACFFSVDRK